MEKNYQVESWKKNLNKHRKLIMPDSENHITSATEQNGENRSHVEVEALELPPPQPRRSIRRSRRQSSRRSNSSAETITMQESSYGGSYKKRQPVTLKASFLRRKIAEYEGKNVKIQENSSSQLRVVLKCLLFFQLFRVIVFIFHSLLELTCNNFTPYIACKTSIYHNIFHFSHAANEPRWVEYDVEQFFICH